MTIAAAPGLTWAQTCNDTGQILQSPDGPYLLGDTVRVTYEFGAGTLQSVPNLTVDPDPAPAPQDRSVVKVALDCINGATAGGREACLGFDGGDPTSQDDGDAILYAGGLTSGNISGDACTGITFTADSAGGALPNLVTFEADALVQFDQGESCFVAFDVTVNSIGDNPESAPLQTVAGASGFEGTCIPGVLGAASNKSIAYIIDLDREIIILKEVSVDGGPFVDANAEPPPFPIGFVPTSTAEYRLTVTNTGEEALVDVVINDPTLGLVNVPLPASCYVNGEFLPNDPCVITSGDAGFADLGDPGICETRGLKTNIACTNGNGVFSGLEAGEACDPANVVCVEPGIDVTKDGPPLAKVGDTITYTICAENTGGVDLANCVLTDTRLGGPTAFAALLVPAQQVCNDYDYTVMGSDPDPLENIATVECDVVGTATSIDDTDNHIVELFQPSIVTTKNGESEGKVGDEVCYDIWFDNTSSADTPALVNCMGTDTVLGDLGAFEDGVVRQFCRTIEPTDPDPLDNTATITCMVDGWDNGLPAPASDDHSVDLFEVGAVLTKSCAPDTSIFVPDPISWEICVENTGDKGIDCTINDPTAGITDASVSVAPGGTDCSTTASRPTTSADVGTVTNTATAVCTVPGYDNDVPTDPATGTCVVDEVGDEFCRTPGFWGTHAGVEKSRSNNLTQAVIVAAGGSLSICGQTIDNTNVGNMMSAVEAMCVHPKGEQQRQLARQLTAAALNCTVFGAGPNCSGASIETEFAAANAACEANAGNLSYHIGIIDAFNNSEECHEAPFGDYEVFDQFDKVPGPAGSSRACNAAVKNETYVVPATP